jgi:ferrous iron transport protein A
MEKRLKDLSHGQSGEVSGYDKADPAYQDKLLAMGLTKGTPFTVRRVAPLGDPIEIEVRGFRLSLRKEEANVLLVRGRG